MLPISDTVIRRHLPWMTWLLIAANVAAFISLLAQPETRIAALIDELALIPARDRERVRLPAELLAGGWMPWIGHMFLHGGLLHLIGNMWTLWLFGDNVEDRMGPLRFLVFYLLCGWVAAATHLVSNPGSPVPVIGASGAIAGVMGAYFVLFPRARIVVLVPLIFWASFIEIPALIYLGVWFYLQVAQGAATSGAAETGGVAFWAHAGGFVAGLLLVWLFLRRDRWQRDDPGYLPRRVRAARW